MKSYILAMFLLITLSTAISGLFPGGWDVLITKALTLFGW
jgi:hypothetical protein